MIAGTMAKWPIRPRSQLSCGWSCNRMSGDNGVNLVLRWVVPMTLEDPRVVPDYRCHCSLTFPASYGLAEVSCQYPFGAPPLVLYRKSGKGRIFPHLLPSAMPDVRAQLGADRSTAFAFPRGPVENHLRPARRRVITPPGLSSSAKASLYQLFGTGRRNVVTI